MPRRSLPLPCSEGITPPKVLPHSACSSRVSSSEGGGTKRTEIQRTEISYYWKYFTQSRRFCIISYKSPIQTELMEKYTSKQPFPTTTSQQPHKEMYKYKLHENCTVHSLAGLGCSSLSRGMRESGFYFLSTSVASFTVALWNMNMGHACCSRWHQMTYRRWDPLMYWVWETSQEERAVVRCANLPHQVEFHFWLKEEATCAIKRSPWRNTC